MCGLFKSGGSEGSEVSSRFMRPFAPCFAGSVAGAQVYLLDRSKRLNAFYTYARTLRNFRGSRKAGFVAAVSDFALIVIAAIEASFAQCGMRPHFINEICRTGSFGCCRITGKG